MRACTRLEFTRSFYLAYAVELDSKEAVCAKMHEMLESQQKECARVRSDLGREQKENARLRKDYEREKADNLRLHTEVDAISQQMSKLESMATGSQQLGEVIWLSFSCLWITAS